MRGSTAAGSERAHAHTSSWETIGTKYSSYPGDKKRGALCRRENVKGQIEWKVRGEMNCRISDGLLTHD
jgi:hypothetical protein